MNHELKLRVLFDAVDRMTRPIKAMQSQSSALAKSLKISRDALGRLQNTQKDVSAFRALHTGLSDTATRLGAAQAQVKALSGSLRAAGPPTRQMTGELAKAREAASHLRAEQKKQVTGLDALRVRLGAAGIDTRKLSEHERALRTNIAATTAAMAKQQDRVVHLSRQREKMAAIQGRFERSSALAGKSAAVGATSGALGGSTLLGAKSLLGPAIEFNASMSKVQALTQVNKDSEEFAALRAQSRHLGATTSYTSTNAADGQGFLAMAGFKPKQILKAMPDVLSMAKAGDTDLARAADISSNIMTGYGLQAEEMPRVADVLTKTFTSSNTTLEMLGDTMKYMGPVAKAAGMSFEQAAAMAGLLGNAGIQASQAGTTLRSMLLRIASPTGGAAKALKELGVASHDAKGNVRDIPTVLQDVAKSMERMKLGSAQKLAYLKAIFGEEPAAGMAELIAQQGADGIGKYTEIVKNSAGTAKRVASIMSDNLKGDLQTARSAWEDLGITISDTVDPALRKVTGTVTKAIRASSQWAQKNPMLAGTLAKIALVMGGSLAVLGTLTMAFAAILVPMAALKMSMSVLGMKGGLLRTVFGGLGSLMKGGAVGSFNKVRQAVSLLGRGTGLLGRIMGSGLVKGFSLARQAASLLASGAGRLGAMLLGGVVKAITMVGRALMILGRLAMGHPLLLFIAVVAMAAIVIWQNWETLGPKFKAMWDTIAQRAGAAGDWFKEKWNQTLEWVQQKLGALGDGFSGIVDRFTAFGGNLMSGLANGIVNGLSAVKSAITGVADSTVGWFKDKLGIRSPSRVFGELGGFISQGAALGIDSERMRVVKAVAGLASAATLAFAAPAAIASTPVLAGPAGSAIAALSPLTRSIPIDTRAPLSSGGSAAGSQGGARTSATGGDTITINIYPAPGADPQAIGRAVEAALERRDREKRSRHGSRLSD